MHGVRSVEVASKIELHLGRFAAFFVERHGHERVSVVVRREVVAFRAVGKNNSPGARALHPESINTLVQKAVTRAGVEPGPYSAHSLRAGFVTYAHLRGASDRAIAHQTRHRSLATIGTYVRVQQAWTDNAATVLGL